MEEKFNNLINNMKNEKMTDAEKTAIWFKVETFSQNNPISSYSSSGLKKSPYFSRHHFFTAGKILVTSFLLMAIGFGGLSYSSASALPGDLLYSIKINVNEKIEEKLVFSQEKKINLRKKRIETRFVEVESLIKENKVNKENREVVEKNIKIEKEKIEKELIQIQETNPEMAKLVKTDIENSIKDHQEKINILIQEKVSTETIQEQVEKQEQSVVTEENTTTENATENVENKEETILPASETIEGAQQIVPKVVKTEMVNMAEEIKTEETLLVDSLKIITAANDVTLSSNKINSDSTNTQESE